MTSRTGSRLRASGSGLRVAEAAGFTLTELLVVIAIIMVLAATAVPALAAFRRGQRLDHSSRLVQSAMNDARRLAITRHARCVIVFYSFEETPGEIDTVRHAIRIYQEATGVAPGPNVDPKVSEGYWKGGYVEQMLVLPANVRFYQERMECKLLQSGPEGPDPNSDFFQRKLRGEKNDALGFRRDGTIEERQDASPTDGAQGRNFFLPDEGCFQVPDAQRADIVIMETDTGGKEVKSRGKARRGFVDLNLLTGRALARVFEVDNSFDYLTTGKGGK